MEGKRGVFLTGLEPVMVRAHFLISKTSASTTALLDLISGCHLRIVDNSFVGPNPVYPRQTLHIAIVNQDVRIAASLGAPVGIPRPAVGQEMVMSININECSDDLNLTVLSQQGQQRAGTPKSIPVGEKIIVRWFG